jgi:hypothetical protein
MQTSGIGFKRAYAPSSIPVWQRDKGMLLAQGGFALVQTGLQDMDVLPAGSPLIFDEAARTAIVLRTGILFADASNTATTYSVKKSLNPNQPLFKVGDYLAAAGGGAAYAITAIDSTTYSDHDVLTVGTTLGVALTAGNTLFRSTATGASAATYGAVNGLLYAETLVELGYMQSVSAVIKGIVYARRVPYNATLAALSGLDDIVYSQSK